MIEELIETPDENLQYLSHETIGGTINIYVESRRDVATCPYCGENSVHVHSRYYRVLQDLPIQDKKSRIVLLNRKYLCGNPKCSHKTFAETYEFYKPKATKTERLQAEILRISLTQSSIAASNYLRHSVAEVGKVPFAIY